MDNCQDLAQKIIGVRASTLLASNGSIIVSFRAIIVSFRVIQIKFLGAYSISNSMAI